ncbi:MAG: hypothetical protein ACE5IK_09755 [Acidobacteriota bacterium]
MTGRLQAQAELIHDALRRIVRELLARKSGAHLVEPALSRIDIPLGIDLTAANSETDAFSRQLTDAIEQQIDDAIERAAAFRPGHTYCHRCSGSDCSHSMPPDSRQVFVGYAPVGTPLWMPFPQYCLEMKHPRVQELYDDRPAFVTIIQDADTLGGELLPAWRNPVYDLLAQLVAGYFRVPSRGTEPRGVVALTFQVTGSTDPGGRRRLAMNVLGRTPAGGDLGLLWERASDLPWRRPLIWAQAALAGVVRPGRRRDGKPHQSRAERDERIGGILGGLARRLERSQRGRQRRTAHAERRHAAGDRPTRKAMDDVRDARPETLLVDERSGALVVLGERGRTHFLTPEGRLVSSVRYSREAIGRKRKLGRWRAASAEESREFFRGLAQTGHPPR